MSKKLDNLFEIITSVQNFDTAYRRTQLGPAKYKCQSLIFGRDLAVNLEALRKTVVSGEYQPGAYSRFMVYEPKEREIYAPKFVDKIVQHAVNNVLKEVYLPCYIRDSYACIDGRGTHRCVARLGHFLRRAKNEWGDDAHIVKMDIRKFFYTIDRGILKGLLRKKIKCSQTLCLLDRIIDSSPSAVGLPLGNLTSQLFANIYLNELDNYCKRVLRLPLYLRYADDAIAIAPDKGDAKAILHMVQVFVESKLNLNLHPDKSTIFPLRQGVNAVGFKNHPTHHLLRNDCKKKIKRKLKSMPRLVKNRRMSRVKAEQMVNSWLGHARHGSSHKFIIFLLKRHSFLAYDGRRMYCRLAP